MPGHGSAFFRVKANINVLFTKEEGDIKLTEEGKGLIMIRFPYPRFDPVFQSWSDGLLIWFFVRATSPCCSMLLRTVHFNLLFHFFLVPSCIPTYLKRVCLFCFSGEQTRLNRTCAASICQNGGLCSLDVGAGTHYCQCTVNYQGKFCETRKFVGIFYKLQSVLSIDMVVYQICFMIRITQLTSKNNINLFLIGLSRMCIVRGQYTFRMHKVRAKTRLD